MIFDGLASIPSMLLLVLAAIWADADQVAEGALGMVPTP